jgi:glycosyltransferase involved in cell wall biosynthesis
MEKKYKLLLLADTAAPHTRRWANWFANNGWEVHIVSFNQQMFEGYKDVKIHLLWKSKQFTSRFFVRIFKSLILIARLYKVIQKIRPDIVHSHSAGSYAWSALFLNFRPRVVTPWGTDILLDTKISKINYLLTKLSLSLATLVTIDAKHFIAHLAKMGVKDENILYLPFGTDIDLFKPQLKLSKSEKIGVISTRTLNPVHDVATLIEAIPNILKHYPNAQFTIVGGGTQLQDFKARCSALNIQGSVEFTGMLSELELSAKLRNSDMYISTSPLDAGLAASTAEAMASSLPIVHPDTADNRIWCDENGGALFKPGNIQSLTTAVVNLISKSEQWAKFGQINRNKIVEQNNLERTMSEMNLKYLSLIKTNNQTYK